jgi:hypothetical protein
MTNPASPDVAPDGTPSLAYTTTPSREVPSSYQFAAMQKQMAEQFKRAIDDVELRKIALQAAVAVHQSQLAAHEAKVTAPVALAREIHAFLSEPARAISETK